MTQPEQSPRRHWTTNAVALVVIGLVILIPSGLCTAVMGGLSLFAMFSPDSANEDLGSIAAVLTVGAPFIIVGGALVVLGFRARKQN